MPHVKIALERNLILSIIKEKDMKSR